MRILLVEDNRDILANLADYLGLKGYTVDCAQDGLSGLHLAATEHYDLIVLDIMLPGIDGYTLCKRLREDARRGVLAAAGSSAEVSGTVTNPSVLSGSDEPGADR